MKTLLTIFIFSSFTLNAQSVHTRNGNRLYKEKKFPEALPEYQKAAEENADDAVVNYNLGDAYFRNEKFDEAEKSYDKPLAEGNDPTLRQRAFYNKGVALSKQSRLEESIAAYKSALLLNPEDNDARINLQKALQEQKKKQDPEKDKKEEQQNNKQKKQEQPPPSESKLNKKQVEQLLKALDQREQQVQQKMMQNRTRAVTKPDKDW
jgi:Ca-activated chloride channel family protein